MLAATYPFQNTSLPWDDRVADLVSRLTLDEKIGQMSHGGASHNAPTPEISRLGVKPYQWGTECISGDVFAGPATSFPMSVNMANSFDAPLLRRTANATAVEVRAKNNDVNKRGLSYFHVGLSCWSPVINIARHPLWGRLQETCLPRTEHQTLIACLPALCPADGLTFDSAVLPGTARTRSSTARWRRRSWAGCRASPSATC
jgi:beta-glucosidase